MPTYQKRKDLWTGNDESAVLDFFRAGATQKWISKPFVAKATVRRAILRKLRAEIAFSVQGELKSIERRIEKAMVEYLETLCKEMTRQAGKRRA